MTSHGVHIDLSRYYSPAMQSSCAPLALPVIHLARSEDVDCIETTTCVALQLGPSSSLMLTHPIFGEKKSLTHDNDPEMLLRAARKVRASPQRCGH
jgi:hypothetical protein